MPRPIQRDETLAAEPASAHVSCDNLEMTQVLAVVKLLVGRLEGHTHPECIGAGEQWKLSQPVRNRELAFVNGNRSAMTQDAVRIGHVKKIWCVNSDSQGNPLQREARLERQTQSAWL